MSTAHQGPGIVVYWLLFFSISFGLGYPTLNRFDARTNNVDAVQYFKLVTGNPSEAGDLLRYRVLVPWVAKPFYRIGEGRIGSWNPIAFGLLVSNSLFTAAGAAAALDMGAWNNAAGNTVPSIFNSIGPILSLSAAQLLAPNSRVERSA